MFEGREFGFNRHTLGAAELAEAPRPAAAVLG